jgi:hypothetical protein
MSWDHRFPMTKQSSSRRRQMSRARIGDGAFIPGVIVRPVLHDGPVRG